MDYMMYNTLEHINIDEYRLMSLGFNQQEIAQLKYVYNNRGKFNTNALQSYGYTYEQAKRLMYMYNICTGKIHIDSKEEMVKHYRKTFGTNYRISMQDLAVSKITSVPRLAFVGNITVEPYTIWNSKQYKGMQALYKVIDATSKTITVETSRKPKIPYGTPTEIKNVLEVKGVRNNGNAVVAFDKNCCRLCNRFVIVASLRNPEFHLGKYELICFEGTKVYIYAINMGTKETLRYGNTQRIYDYGIFGQTIRDKLDNVAKEMYKHLCGVGVEYHGPTMDYEVLPKEQEEEDVSDGVIA